VKHFVSKVPIFWRLLLTACELWCEWENGWCYNNLGNKGFIVKLIEDKIDPSCQWGVILFHNLDAMLCKLRWVYPLSLL
jgi:hypothetical protein